MGKKGHNILITARDKDVTHKLLENYKINYVNRGKGRKTIFGKLLYIIEADYKLFNIANKFKPDIFLSFGSPYAAHISKILNKPHIAFDDTEHAVFEHLLYVPFTNTIITPVSFQKDFHNKHIIFDGSMDLAYLHSNHFKPDSNIYKLLKINSDEKYVLLRFVSWNASHDINQKGFSLIEKIELVKELVKHYKVFISSEGSLPCDLEKYKINISADKIHDVLAYSELYIGESTTMATEAATLGTTSICMNTSIKYLGVFNDFIKQKSIYSVQSLKEILEIINNVNNEALNNFEYNNQKQRKFDLTLFMVWFLEKYPLSFKIMKENPDYQYNFY